jgi:hypothetical protein
MTPSGIESATLWLVAQYLNQLRHRVPLQAILYTFQPFQTIYTQVCVYFISISTNQTPDNNLTNQYIHHISSLLEIPATMQSLPHTASSHASLSIGWGASTLTSQHDTLSSPTLRRQEKPLSVIEKKRCLYPSAMPFELL